MESNKKSLRQWIALALNCGALGIGAASGPMLLRFYFLHGGSRRWFSTWLETAGFPILILPISISYYMTKRTNTNTNNRVTPMLCFACIGVGVLTGLSNYMYAWGVSYFPVSTSSLLIATQLGFNALFSFIIVKQTFTSYSINAVVLLIMGPILLAFQSNGDRPKGVTTRDYWLGFGLTGAAAASAGLITPLVELVMKKANNKIIPYRLVMEIQLIISFSATVFATVGMVVNKDFQAIAREARASDVGEFNYYMAIVWSAIVWQISYIGAFGVIFQSSSFLSGLLIAVFIFVTEVLAVIFYHEEFSGEKGMSLAMAMWAFASYLYGEYKGSKLEVSNMNMNTIEDGESKIEISNINVIDDSDGRSISFTRTSLLNN